VRWPCLPVEIEYSSIDELGSYPVDRFNGHVRKLGYSGRGGVGVRGVLFDAADRG
jgi:hypothetical protein